MSRSIVDIANDHDKWRYCRCINLIPSENIMSPQARTLMSSDLGHRYTLPFNNTIHGATVENAYRGTRFMDEIEDECKKLACKVFKAKYACVKPLSGHISALISLLSVTKKGDKILGIESNFGGYDGYGKEYIPDIYGLKAGFLPFDSKIWNIDHDASVKLIEKEKPQAVVAGASFILFPYEIKKLKTACKSVKSRLLYDGSHVLGLVAGGEFQPDPLGNGVDIFYGSTHKTFPGPQGGIILTNDMDLINRIERNITWRILDNAHWNRIAALAQTLAEMEKFGHAYAQQTVKNAKALGKSLHERGFPIKFSKLGYTQSHQLAIDTDEILKKYGMDINRMAIQLENSCIITDAVGRLGLNEVTRMGMKTADMERIAELMVKAVKEKCDVSREAQLLREDFEIEYCFQ